MTFEEFLHHILWRFATSEILGVSPPKTIFLTDFINFVLVNGSFKVSSHFNFKNLQGKL